ncbi:hypothetical protein V8J88_04475 [Massilia sp. W12]|uniref:hypothetical protein n=1 Tax=Massilia sp. W12 TaxID=3126507 RepID=UPI0030D54B02
MIVLPNKNETDGCETRLLLAECRGPSNSSYTLADAKLAMQYMDRVLYNRLADPKPYGAPGAKTIADVVRAKGQFAGFQNYPNYDTGIVHRIQAALDIANSTKDPRQAVYAAFIMTAIEVSKSNSITDPSPGKLTGWRTAGSTAPGGSFKFFKTFFGNDFYYV